MTLSGLNAADTPPAREALLECCGSRSWVDHLIARRPFADAEELRLFAGEVWWSLDPADWLEAFSKHPQIGEKKPLTEWSSEEQRGMRTANPGIVDSIAEMNRAYRERFGWIFIVCATGKNPEEIRALLKERLENTASKELHIAAEEQARITDLRLRKLLGI
jgi:OHCU decarboxylase